ncbi:MAG: hypothetical protein V7745_04740 [Pseudomonadales bacterium]
MSSNEKQVPFSIPEQTLRTLSFCEPTPRHLSEWIDQLPMGNLGESSRQLYHAMIELNQLIVDPETRLKLIEILRTPIQQVCENLTKHYLNQPVVLPVKARKVSRLAMALDNHLMVAYKSVVEDRKRLSQTLISKKPKKIVALAIYHAMSITVQIIVRSYHLYNPAPRNSWHELHQLYLIAESNRLLDFPIEDNNNKFVQKTNIADAYKRALMMGCCKANQIRQRDITSIYHASELWSKHVHLVGPTQEANFIVNLNDDIAPIYSELASGKNSPFSRGIDLQPLLELFKDYLQQSSEGHDSFSKGITVPETINRNLLSYLVKSWETLSERSAARLPSDKFVTLCFGFSATHFFLSGGVDFDTQLQRGNVNAQQNNNAFDSRDVKPLVDSSDPWGTAFDADHHSTNPIDHSDLKMPNAKAAMPNLTQATSGSSQTSYPQYKSRLLDISPNGYCIKWDNEAPVEIKAGEIIGINEQQSHNWTVGVIRWISHPKTGVTTMGVELLAAAAIPCGAKVVTESRHKSDYMRALLLPSLDAMGKPASFIAPNMPFKENLSVILNQYGETSQGILGDCTLSTGSFSQFTFEPQALRADLSEDEYEDDDTWPEI